MPNPRREMNPRNRRSDMSPEDKMFDERVVHVDRIARVVKGGRRFRFRALVVVGDHKNRVGIGISKGADVSIAVTKANEAARKNLITIPIYKGTLPHDAEVKFSGARILLKPASPGTGLIAGGVVRTILEVAGVSNALSKSLGSSNKTNTAYATIKALQSIKSADQWVTRQRGEQPEKAVIPKAAPIEKKPKTAAKVKPAPKKEPAK
jgi:small subunit ribosomal protein S5